MDIKAAQELVQDLQDQQEHGLQESEKEQKQGQDSLVRVDLCFHLFSHFIFHIDK
jgi:hypothetical protein